MTQTDTARPGHRLLLNHAAGASVSVADRNRANGDPRDFHRRLPGYAPTELRDLPAVASQLGVGAVLAKVEQLRLGLPSYKILGASWATYRAIEEREGQPIGTWTTVEELRGLLHHSAGTRLVAATDGNHGRALARMAALLGWPARILVPAGTAQARLDGIAAEGAEIEIVDGTYDEAVAAAAALSDEHTLVISDTAWPGYTDIPGWVIDGYGTIFAEVEEQLGDSAMPTPTHAVVPVGVGALATAAARNLPPETSLISVEPTSAACVLASVAAGAAVEVPGPHTSSMAGLNCGLPNPIALPIIQRRFAGLVAIDEEWAEEAVRVLASLDLPVGESAAAALGGLLALTPDERAALGLSAESVVLLLLTEGVTDPVNHRRIVGRRTVEPT